MPESSVETFPRPTTLPPPGAKIPAWLPPGQNKLPAPASNIIPQGIIVPLYPPRGFTRGSSDFPPPAPTPTWAPPTLDQLVGNSNGNGNGHTNGKALLEEAALVPFTDEDAINSAGLELGSDNGNGTNGNRLNYDSTGHGSDGYHVSTDYPATVDSVEFAGEPVADAVIEQSPDIPLVRAADALALAEADVLCARKDTQRWLRANKRLAKARNHYYITLLDAKPRPHADEDGNILIPGLDHTETKAELIARIEQRRELMRGQILAARGIKPEAEVVQEAETVAEPEAEPEAEPPKKRGRPLDEYAVTVGEYRQAIEHKNAQSSDIPLTQAADRLAFAQADYIGARRFSLRRLRAGSRVKTASAEYAEVIKTAAPRMRTQYKDVEVEVSRYAKLRGAKTRMDLYGRRKVTRKKVISVVDVDEAGQPIQVQESKNKLVAQLEDRRELMLGRRLAASHKYPRRFRAGITFTGDDDAEIKLGSKEAVKVINLYILSGGAVGAMQVPSEGAGAVQLLESNPHVAAGISLAALESALVVRQSRRQAIHTLGQHLEAASVKSINTRAAGSAHQVIDTVPIETVTSRHWAEERPLITADAAGEPVFSAKAMVKHTKALRRDARHIRRELMTTSLVRRAGIFAGMAALTGTINGFITEQTDV